jgi:rhamnose transport system permease protein
MTSLLRRMNPQSLRVLALAIVLVLLILFFSTQIEGYFSPRMLNRILTSSALILPIAVGQALVIMTRNIDLSVGWIVGLTAFMIGDVLTYVDLGPVPTLLLFLIVGGMCGAINGALVSYGRIPSIIVTLGTMTFFRWALVEYSKVNLGAVAQFDWTNSFNPNSKTITTDALPKWITEFPQYTVFSIGDFEVRLLVVIALISALMFWVVLSRLRVARKFYAVGSNPDAAVMAGINSQRVVFTAFVLSGMMAGLGGMMFLARFGIITVVAGQGFELKSIAASVVGGVNIFGGSGSMVGVMLGTVLIDTLENSLLRWQVISEFWRDALLGILIMLAVAADTFMTRSFARLRAKKEL